MALQLFKIASTTVETPQTSITFSSIPQGYTDLKLVSSTRTNYSSVNGVNLHFNGDLTQTYTTSRWLSGNGATASSSNNTSMYIAINNDSSTTSNTFSNNETYIPNYTGSSNKSSMTDSVTENNGTTAYAYMIANLKTASAAITSITLAVDAGAFVAGSTFTLYGVM